MQQPLGKVDSVSAGFHSFLMSGVTGKAIEAAEWERRALALESEMRLDEAREAFDAALRLDPSSQSLAEGRARIAIQSDEEGAAIHCSRALAFHDSEPKLKYCPARL